MTPFESQSQVPSPGRRLESTRFFAKDKGPDANLCFPDPDKGGGPQTFPTTHMDNIKRIFPLFFSSFRCECDFLPVVDYLWQLILVSGDGWRNATAT